MGKWINFYIRTRQEDDVKARLKALQETTTLSMGELLAALITNEEKEPRILQGKVEYQPGALEKRIAAIENYFESLGKIRNEAGEWQEPTEADEELLVNDSQEQPEPEEEAGAPKNRSKRKKPEQPEPEAVVEEKPESEQAETPKSRSRSKRK